MPVMMPGRISNKEQKPYGICMKTVSKRLNPSLNGATGKVWKNNNKSLLTGKEARKCYAV